MNKYKIKIPLLLSFLLLSFIVGTASAEQVVVTSKCVLYDTSSRLAAIKLPGVGLVHTNLVIDGV